MKLYEITGEYREIQAALEEAGGELTPEIEARINSNQETLEQKLENIAKLDAELHAGILACREEKKRMDWLEDTRQASIDSLRAYALRYLQAAEIKKVETPLFTISRQANPARVVVDDYAAIPRRFLNGTLTLPYEEFPKELWEIAKQTELQKSLVKKELLNHPETTIPGVHLEAGESLRIK